MPLRNLLWRILFSLVCFSVVSHCENCVCAAAVWQPKDYACSEPYLLCKSCTVWTNDEQWIGEYKLEFSLMVALKISVAIFISFSINYRRAYLSVVFVCCHFVTCGPQVVARLWPSCKNWISEIDPSKSIRNSTLGFPKRPFPKHKTRFYDVRDSYQRGLAYS